MSLRRRLAEWLCPELAQDSDRLWYMQIQLADAYRWLGEFPDIEAVTEWIDGTVEDHYRPLGEPAKCKWRAPIDQFREQLRSRASLQHKEACLNCLGAGVTYFLGRDGVSHTVNCGTCSPPAPDSREGK